KGVQRLNAFALPGGGGVNACLHQALTVGRRAECVCWRLKRDEPVSDQLLAYINRLSDHLFVQSRWVAKRLDEPEFLWDRGLRIDEERAAKHRPAPKARAGNSSAGSGKS